MKHLERLPREVALEESRKMPGTGCCFARRISHRRCGSKSREKIWTCKSRCLELPTEFREAVVLCELEEKSYEEAAQLIGFL